MKADATGMKGFKSSSYMQAACMAECVGIELQPEETRLYCMFREREFTLMNGHPKEGEGLCDAPWKLSDQGLLGRVLQISGDDRARKFAAFYSTILF